MSILYFALLGTPELRHGEHPLTFPTRKALALLIYLAVEGGIHTRKHISELFWPELDAEHGRAALRATLQQLRIGFAEAGLMGESEHLRIDRNVLEVDLSSDLSLDISTLHAAWKQAETGIWTDARTISVRDTLYEVTRLIRGEFLAGFTLREATAFDDWTRYQRDTINRQLQQVYERLTVLQIETGEIEHALDTVTRWLAFDPVDERGYQHLMRLHVARGDRIAALRAYQACCSILSTELQLDPTPETVALAEQVRLLVLRADRKYVYGVGSLVPATSATFDVPLVGRAREFRMLVQHYQQALQGYPQVVLIEGEAGIGKTRLASDMLSWARSQGAVVLHGRAFEMGGTLPYQPLIHALRPALVQETTVQGLLAPGWLIELSRLFPELCEPSTQLAVSLFDDASARSRLFEAVVRLIRVLSHGKPLVLFVDDMQWADTATFDLLLYTLRAWTEQSQPALLLCSLRREQQGLSSLSSWISGLQRIGNLSRLALGLLTQADILRLLESLQHVALHSPSEGHTLTPVSQWLYNETEGHPFYLVETIKTLLDRHMLTTQRGKNGRWTVDFTLVMENIQSTRHVVSHTVIEVITARLHRLTQQAQTFLVAGAVLGKHLIFEQLCYIAEMTEKEGLTSLDEVVQAALLREELHEQEIHYQFVHDTIREVIYTEAITARKRIFHRRALEILQTQRTPAAELARHAIACGQKEMAFRYNIQAGNEAMVVFAVQDAIVYFEQARHLVGISPELLHVEDDALLEQLYLHLGRAYELLEQWELVQRTYEAMLISARATHQSTMACMALNHLAFLAVLQAFDIEKARVLLREAQGLAMESHDQLMEAEVAWNLAQTVLYNWHLQEAQQYGLHALTLARMLDEPELIARSLYVLSIASLYEGNYTQVFVYATEAIELYTTLRMQTTSDTFLPIYLILSGASPSFQQTNQAALIGCLILRLDAYVCIGEVSAALEDGRRAVHLSLDTKNNVLRAWSLQNLNHALIEAGLYEEALMVALQADQLVKTNSNVLIRYYVAAVLGITYQALSLLEKAQGFFEEAIALVKTLPTEEQQLLVLPWLCVNQGLAGAWQDAAVTAKEVIRLRRQTEAGLIIKGFTSPFETRALLASGEKEEAKWGVRRLGEQIGTNRRFRISYLRSLALLAHDDGEAGQAIVHLQEAIYIADELGLLGEQWQMQAVLGDLFRMQGREEQAYAAWTRARAIIEELAGRIQDEDLRSSFLGASQIRRVLEREQVVYYA